MSINLTDEIEVKTKKGKLGAAKQIFLEGDTTSLQKAHEDNQVHFDTLDNRSSQMEESIKNISVTGGASIADAVTYDNTISGLEAVNVKSAVDELAKKSKEQDTEIVKKANSTDVTSQMQTEQTRVNTELEKKFDKSSITQESGEAENKVMSQKAVSDKLSDLTDKSNRVNAELRTKLPKDTNLDSSVSDGSKIFVVTDSTNNVAFRVDSEGTKARKYNICDENGNVVETITKELLEKIEKNESDVSALQDTTSSLDRTKLPKDTNSNSLISDGSDELVVADAANKVGLKVDKEGAKVNILNICDENGKVVKTITKEEVSEDTKSFSIIDLKGNKSLEVDNDGVKARKYNICDENGKVVKTITSELFDNIEKNRQNSLWWKDKNIFLLGDSLGQIPDIQRVFSQYSMSNWHPEYVGAVLSAGGTQTLSRYTLDMSGDERASYLKQINESRNIDIDVIFFMTNNDAGTSFVKNEGNKSQEPYYESQILRNLDVTLSKENFRNEFNERFSEIIGNAQTKNTSALTWGTKVTWSEKGNVTPKGQSILFVPIEYDNVNTYILKINKASNVNGSVKIKSNVNGFKENTITITEGDSIEEIMNKILICDFGTVLDLKSSDTEISFTNTLYPNTNNITLESSSDDINNIFTLSNSVGIGYIETPIVYKSLDTTNWNNAEYWVLRDTEYTPEFNAESSKFGPSAWQVYSGIIQYLQMTFPRALIIGLYPTIGWGKMNSYKYNNSDFINYSKFRTDYQNRYNYDRHRALMKEIFNYYCCPFIDFNECSGLSAINAISGGFYKENGDIHPFSGDNGGSARWGVTLANVLL